MNLAIGPAPCDLAPARDLALRLGRPQRLQLGDGDVVAQVFFGIDDDGEAVVGDRQLDVLDAGLLAGLDLGGADRPRGVADVGLAAAELLEAAAGAGDADRDADAGVGLLELLGDGFADGETPCSSRRGVKSVLTARQSGWARDPFAWRAAPVRRGRWRGCGLRFG